MADFRLGDEVLAPWLHDGFLYPAILVAANGPNGHVAYLDGDEADVPLDALRLGVFGPGVAVQVNWKGKLTYYGATIVGRVGAALQVVYDTGEREWTATAKCRIRQEIAAALPATHVACPFCGAAMSDAQPRCPQCGAPRVGRA